MSRHLHAWRGAERVGVFEDDGTTVSFTYDAAARGPISLSLPMDASGMPGAARSFLLNLLPEDGNTRLSARIAAGAESEDPFDLLPAIDTAGGLVFTREDSPKEFADEPLEPMTIDDMQAQARKVWQTSAAWWDVDKRQRFSLAGAQGKFTAALIDGVWCWPSGSIPSTHIFKPDTRVFPGVARIESACLSLAGHAGLDRPSSEVLELADHDAHVIGRFDRRPGDSDLAVRVHVEDLCQAMGIPSSEKYDHAPSEIAGVLRRGGMAEERVETWFAQLAFNVLVGNSDAHAKNYSIYLDGGPVRPCPIYDCPMTRYWPELDPALAMPVNGVWQSSEIGLSDWEEEARACGLDKDRVCSLVLHTLQSVLQGFSKAAEGLSEESKKRMARVLIEGNARLIDDAGHSRSDIEAWLRGSKTPR